MCETNSNKKRMSYDTYFMKKAELAAEMATCCRLSVGAVLVKKDTNEQLIDVMTGWNGSLPGHAHCTDEGVGCLIHEGGCKRTVHAEMNVIDRCARFGVPTEGGILYVTHYPCPSCMQHIVNVGIKEIVYRDFYNHRFENNFHEGILIRQYNT